MISLILDQHCCLCGKRCIKPTCEDCWNDQDILMSYCFTCALPLPKQTSPDEKRHICSDCTTLPKPFTRSVAAFRYHAPTNYLVKQFKQHKKLQIGEELTQVLAHKVAEDYADDNMPNVLVPTPQHWFKQLIRGYNPPSLIAKHLSKQLEIPIENALKKQFATKAQQTLDRMSRLKNLEDVYAARSALNDRHIAVVDDVMTTSATAICTADALLRAGAARVDIWAIARTPKK